MIATVTEVTGLLIQRAGVVGIITHTATTATLEHAGQSATFDATAATITFNLEGGIKTTVPARTDLEATYIATAMIDGIIPVSHDPDHGQPANVRRHHWF